MSAQKEQKISPHYLGHRDRLKKRFVAGGAASLADYELLELVLTYILPRKDVKPLAKELLEKYGSLGNVFSAPLEKITQEKGLGENSALFLKLVEALSVRVKAVDTKNKDVVQSRAVLVDYLSAKMGRLPREEFHVVYLDSKNHILADEMLFAGTINKSAVYPREIMKKALDFGATGLVLAHNHPSGQPTPSAADEELTMQVVQLSALMGIVVHDHIIVGQAGYFSFKDHGKM